MPTKVFSLGACLSVTTGRLLCDFGDMHELVEWLLGHPVWTNELADKAIVERIKAAMLAQCPELAEVDASGFTRENWKDKLAEWHRTLGMRRIVTQGTGERTEGPVMPPNANVVVVEPFRGPVPE